MDVLLHSRTLIAICQRRKSSECGSFLKPVASRRPSFLFERFERPSMAAGRVAAVGSASRRLGGLFGGDYVWSGTTISGNRQPRIDNLPKRPKMPSSRKNCSTWQTCAKRSPTTSRIVLQAGKWHEPISHSARRARLQPASEEADGVLLDGNGNIVRER